MEINPINKKVHDVLISKGYTWRARAGVDVYKKDGTIIFIYMTDYCFMLINGKVATSKEFEDATQLSS
jgi:hypothetical protein